MTRATRPLAHLAINDQPIAFERDQMLARAADRHLRRRGQAIGSDLSLPFNLFEQGAPSLREALGHGIDRQRIHPSGAGHPHNSYYTTLTKQSINTCFTHSIGVD